ncbi:hypothetical protein Y1Q_0001976 [Alligator mississippiensis]|uniref:Endonuclease/exonuclease/phosphatase domain-containing protein n=1 Tax=Alligator mississippiensis TaxID=8496 RepID=A0A151PGQ9_ALLMI|nr:hypothetical protein Y1Q_0001976 [Alligator mississippiensis]
MLTVMSKNNQHATIISVYALTLNAANDVKEQFYSDLGNALTNIPKEDKIILLGDFNTRLGSLFPVGSEKLLPLF